MSHRETICYTVQKFSILLYFCGGVILTTCMGAWFTNNVDDATLVISTFMSLVLGFNGFMIGILWLKLGCKNV